MKIKLHPSQGTVFLSTSRFKVVAAGRRWGKTVLACAILFTEAIKNPDGIYWLVAPTYGQAKELAWTILVKMIPIQCLAKQPNETELSFKFKNGAEIHLKGADNPETLRGRGLRGLVIDEVATIRNHKSVWEEILRPSLADYQGFCVFIGTPKGKNYFWELWLKGQRKEDDFESWQFTTENNPYIPRSEIKAAKETTSERYFSQEYLANFESYVGLIWPEFEQKHIIEPFILPTNWERIGTLDPAVSGTTASLQSAIDEDGKLFIFSEYYEQNKRANEVADVIKDRASTWYGDPAGKIRSVSRNGVLFSLFDEYSESGLYLIPAQNDVSAGINRVAEYFKSGKIGIFRNCKNLVYELERYHWSEERETSLGIMEPKPYKALDHLCDCLRYLVMSREDPSKHFKEPVKQWSVDDIERMEKQQNQVEEYS
jgi:hypothetical protein